MNSKAEFIGFNDMVPWRPGGGGRLHLTSAVGSRPPIAGDLAEVRLLAGEGGARVLGETDCWNFPQGARQQWLPGGREIVFNARENGVPCAWVVGCDGTGRRKLSTQVYSLSANGEVAFGLNFGRLQRLGGYGYAGLPDETAGSATPRNDGIWSVPLEGSERRLLVSIAEVAEFGRETRAAGAGHHYLTHVLPSPSGRRIAFLHRCWLPDGGLNTRLLTLELDGRQLRLWAEGYLSHFDWRDEQTLVIWGRVGRQLGRMRQQAGGLSLVPRPLLRLAKDVLRPLLGRSAAMRCHYLVLREDGQEPSFLAPGELKMDGHPSFLPSDRSWMLSDTYPDKAGWRELFLFDWAQGRRHLLGRFQEFHGELDTSRLAEAVVGIDPMALQNFNPKVFAYNRSGFYCDFHPRWKPDGSEVCFDSNHEGNRRVYSVGIPAAVIGREVEEVRFNPNSTGAAVSTRLRSRLRGAGPATAESRALDWMKFDYGSQSQAAWETTGSTYACQA
jgi:hypothetical protein